MNNTKTPTESETGLVKSDVIGRFFFTDIFKDDIIVVTRDDGNGYYGFYIKNGRWNGNTKESEMKECTLDEVKTFIEKQKNLVC